jgi:hypothetical protein
MRKMSSELSGCICALFSEKAGDTGDLATMQNQGGETEGEHCQGQPKKQAPIALNHYAKDCEMARNRAAHHTQRQQRSSPGKARTHK